MSSAKVSKRPMTAGRAKKIAKNSLVHIILAILVVIWLFPIFWIIMTSLRGESGAYTAYFFPKELTFNNYKRLFTETTLLNFPRAFMNTLIISIFSCLISTTFVLSVSYCMSRLRFRMRKTFMNSLIRYQSLCQKQRFWMDVISSRYFTRSSFRSVNQSLYIRSLRHSLLHGLTSYLYVSLLDQRISIGRYHFSCTICWRKSL